MSREHINPMQWHQAQGVARQVSARIFRDGGNAADAMTAFGLDTAGVGNADWSRAVETIAEALCARRAAEPMKRAA